MTTYIYTDLLVAGTTAKAEDVNTRFLAVQTAFASIDTDVSRAVRVVTGTLTAIPGAALTRAKGLLMFDAAGDITYGKTLLDDLSAGGKKITNLPSPGGVTEPVTLGYLNTYSASLAGIPSVAGNAGKVLFTDGVAVSWNNSVLLPLQTGNNGKFVTTDGATPSWVSINQVSAIGNDRGVELLHDGTTYSWALPRANRLLNTSGALGTFPWTATTVTIVSEVASSSNGASVAGYHFKNTGVVTTTGDFTSEFVAANVGETWTASALILTNAISAGTVTFVVEFYSAGLGSLGATAVALVAATDRRYSVSGVGPATTAWVRVRIKWNAATSGEIRIRRAKIELNTYATPFNDDAAIQGLMAPSATMTWGNQTSPFSMNLRSAAGAQAYDVQFQVTGGTGGSAGKGALTVTAARTIFTSVVGFSSENNLGNSGAAIAADLGLFQYQKITCTLNTTITLTAPVMVATPQLKLVDSGGPRTIAWAGTAVTWLGGSTPTFSSAGKTLFVRFYYDGTTLYGSWSEV